MERVKYTIRAHVRSFSFNSDNLGGNPIVPRHWVMVEYGWPSCNSGQIHSAKLMGGFKGICQNYPNRCPALPESCSILKELPQRGRRFVGTGRKLL